jgi:hypothetical protein
MILSTYSRVESGSQRNVCSLMFGEAFFIMTEVWKQPKCLPRDKWVTEREGDKEHDRSGKFNFNIL